MRRSGNGQASLAPDVWSWRVQAACRGTDTALFFGPEGERPSGRAIRERKAKAICAVCPVLELCRLYALSHYERHGVWGGLGEQERLAILVDTPPGAGLHHPVA
jgi:WhiB family redox-sensing transcriptional regulator